MGKNSLIKSTSKKADEEEKKKKKTPAKTKSAAGKKTSAKKTTAAAKKTTKAKTTKAAASASKAKKTASSAEKKAAAPKAKKTAAPKTKKAAAPKAKKAAAPKAKKAPKKKAPLSKRDLLFKSFAAPSPEKLFKPAATETAPGDFTAPPYFAPTGGAELERLRSIQYRQFRMADLEAAAPAAPGAPAERAASEAPPPEAVPAEPEPDVSVSYDPPPAAAEPADPMEKMFKYAIAGFGLLVLILVGVSMMNQGHYYLKPADGSLEIWQGRFAPMGQDQLMVLSGVAAPEPLKDVYSQGEVYPIIFSYYVDKADALLTVPGLPDYAGMRTYLEKALAYASTPALREAAFSRLDSIEFMTLVYKADVATKRGSDADLEEALGYLEEARTLDLDDGQVELVERKIDTIKETLSALEAQ